MDAREIFQQKADELFWARAADWPQEEVDRVLENWENEPIAAELGWEAWISTLPERYKPYTYEKVRDFVQCRS